MELVQELGTAEGPAADAQAAQHLGLVPHTDLPQLDAGMDGAGQVLHQGPEVHPPVGGEEEQDLVPLEAILRLHQLHVQPVLGDLLLADGEGLFLLLLVPLQGQLVLLGGLAHHRAQGGHQLDLVDHGVSVGTKAVFRAPGGVHNDAVPHLELLAVGIEVILLAALFKADTDDLYHCLLLWSGLEKRKTF